jgi:hypothetical protein
MLFSCCGGILVTQYLVDHFHTKPNILRIERLMQIKRRCFGVRLATPRADLQHDLAQTMANSAFTDMRGTP